MHEVSGEVSVNNLYPGSYRVAKEGPPGREIRRPHELSTTGENLGKIGVDVFRGASVTH